MSLLLDEGKPPEGEPSPAPGGNDVVPYQTDDIDAVGGTILGNLFNAGNDADVSTGIGNVNNAAESAKPPTVCLARDPVPRATPSTMD